MLTPKFSLLGNTIFPKFERYIPHPKSFPEREKMGVDESIFELGAPKVTQPIFAKSSNIRN